MQTVYLDTETTGLTGIYAGGADEVVELAILDDLGQPILNQFVRPKRRKTWPEAQRIHGIAPESVAGALTLEELLPKVSQVLRNRVVVIYNAAFDVQFLPESVFEDSRVECAMLRYAKWKGEWNPRYGNHRWHTLRAAADATGFNAKGSWHRALTDTLACRHVWRHLAQHE